MAASRQHDPRVPFARVVEEVAAESAERAAAARARSAQSGWSLPRNTCDIGWYGCDGTHQVHDADRLLADPSTSAYTLGQLATLVAPGDPRVFRAMLALPSHDVRLALVRGLNRCYAELTLPGFLSSASALQRRRRGADLLLEVVSSPPLSARTCREVLASRLLTEEALLALLDAPRCSDVLLAEFVARRPAKPLLDVLVQFGSSVERAMVAMCGIDGLDDARQLLKAARVVVAQTSGSHAETLAMLDALGPDWVGSADDLAATLRALR